MMDRMRGMQDELSLKDRALSVSAEGIVIADARLPDMPLIYVNEGFERITGYTSVEVVGRNCRFLQGPGTDPSSLEKLRSALRENRACTVLLLNYRKDGSVFWNRLSITPVRDGAGEVSHFIGVQSDVTAEQNALRSLEKSNKQLEVANRSLREDLEAAALVQKSFLPSAPPVTAGVKWAWMFRPCTELAGDMFGAFALDDHRIAAYILDVSGHGVAAALLSVTLSRMLLPDPGSQEAGAAGTSAKSVNQSPAQVLDVLNRRFPLDPRVSQYFTMVYGVLDARELLFQYATAGHWGPIHVPKRGNPSILPPGGLPIGLFRESDYSNQALQMSPGDRLYMYTDGFLEAENPQNQAFGLERLIHSLDAGRQFTLDGSMASLTREVEGWRGTPELEDDLSILAFEISDPA